MKLSILIVNYNTETYITTLLEQLTLQSLSSQEFEIIIANNIQNTKLSTLVTPYLGRLNLKVVQSALNVGFGRANNLAAQHATGEHLLIMNPDIRMLQSDYLEQLYLQVQQHPNYGIITTQLLNDDGIDGSEFYAYEFQHHLGFEGQIAWFSGALLLIKPDVFNQIQGFDPDFFMYCEDEDLCYRVKRLELPLIKLHMLKVHHIGGSSEPNKGYDMHHRWYRSQLLFAYKHFSADEFKSVMKTLESKAKRRTNLYKWLQFLQNKRFLFKQNKWQAMLDVVKKTRLESPLWLVFTLSNT